MQHHQRHRRHSRPQGSLHGNTTISSAIPVGIRTAGSLGTGTVTFTAAGTLYSQSASTISNAFVLTSAGTINNQGNALTLSGGAGALTLSGKATTTIGTNALANTGGLVVNAPIATTLTGGNPLGQGAVTVNHNLTFASSSNAGIANADRSVVAESGAVVVGRGGQ